LRPNQKMPETIAALLRKARAELKKTGIETAALDARLLLQAAANLRHGDIVADSRQMISDVTLFESYVMRRKAFEPVSRILGEREFYGRSFKVTPDVLDPRADTETLIDGVLPLIRNLPSPRILDLGTGCGILAITLLAEVPQATGLATDVSSKALAVAKDNAVRLGVADRLDAQCTDWFEGVEGLFDLIVSNPPYIPAREIESLMRDVRDFDPHIALDGGKDGMAAYRILAGSARNHLRTNGNIAVEIGSTQAKDVKHLFLFNNFSILDVKRDIAEMDRALIFAA
jgi:release factor glutamine methyltransferase